MGLLLSFFFVIFVCMFSLQKSKIKPPLSSILSKDLVLLNNLNSNQNIAAFPKSRLNLTYFKQFKKRGYKTFNKANKKTLLSKYIRTTFSGGKQTICMSSVMWLTKQCHNLTKCVFILQKYLHTYTMYVRIYVCRCYSTLNKHLLFAVVRSILQFWEYKTNDNKKVIKQIK